MANANSKRNTTMTRAPQGMPWLKIKACLAFELLASTMSNSFAFRREMQVRHLEQENPSAAPTVAIIKRAVVPIVSFMPGALGLLSDRGLLFDGVHSSDAHVKGGTFVAQ
mmetsp:Transcript_82106/g.145563  ORF Transcript_82106/g.145563 Transcript_82106/m.145563 type:complete len:110 (+) Transcript_82106:1549-1878(+)